MGALTISTLPTPRVLHDGVPCHFSIRKVFALTLYLAVTAQPHRRAALVALLWPDADEAHGLLSLRQTLLRMRQVLGTDADAHLVSTGDLVRLNLGAQGSVDVDQLSVALTVHASPVQRMLAVHAYEGPFLAHVTIDDAPDFMAWVTAQRAHWDACFDGIAEQQIQWLLDDGRADAASTLGQTWVARRPEVEAAYRLLASAQATAGDVSGAQQTLAAAVHHWAELGLDPPAQTQALRASLASMAHGASVPIGMSRTSSRRVLRLPFLGRREALIHLREAYQHMQTGSPGAALILGEAGVGKSRLLRLFMRWAAVQGADVALGRAYELSARLSYQPLMELLRERLALERAPDDLVEDSWLIEVQRLVPDLHDRYPDLPPPVDDAAAGARLLEAIAQLGLALARRRPLVWLLDDLQWADEATLDGMLFLMQRWREAKAPVLVIYSLRRDDVGASPTLERWVAAARQTMALTEVTLPLLSADMTRQAMTTLFADSASPEICTWLQETTGGNPLYLEHVVHALAERGAVRWQDDTARLGADVEVAALTGWLPDTLRGLLLRSVRQLDPVAQQTLAAAAVLGTHFDEGVLTQVAGVEEEAVLAALELAERRLLIRAEAGAYRFAHDKVAEAVYSDLTLARRRVYHRRALQALTADGLGSNAAASSAADLARHALAAQDWEAGVHHSRRAAAAAQQIGAHREAVRHLEQVVQLLTTSPGREALHSRVSDEARTEVYGALGLLYANLGERARAQALHDALLADARERGARVLEARVLEMQGRYALDYERDYERARHLFEASQAIAQEQGDTAGLLGTERNLASVAEFQGDFDCAADYAHHMVQQARASGYPQRLAQGLNFLADVLKRRGQWEDACTTCEEGLMLWADLANNTTSATDQGSSATDIGDPPSPHPFTPGLTWATFFPRIARLAHPEPTTASHRSRIWGANDLMGMGTARLHVGEGDIGRAALQMGWQIFTELNEQRFHSHYLLHWILGRIEAGDYESALHEAQEIVRTVGVAIIRPLDTTDIRPSCALADAQQALFQLMHARSALEQAAAFAPNKPIWERLLPATRWVRQHALAGDWAAAHTAALAAQALRDEMPSPLTWFDFARYHETEALLRAGERARAHADVQRLGEHLGANRRYRLVYLRMQALLDRDAGAHAGAVAHLGTALQLATHLGLPGEQWQIAAELASSYGETGDAERARETHLRAEGMIATLAARITDSSLREHFVQAALAQLPALRHATTSGHRPMRSPHEPQQAPTSPHKAP